MKCHLTDVVSSFGHPKEQDDEIDFDVELPVYICERSSDFSETLFNLLEAGETSDDDNVAREERQDLLLAFGSSLYDGDESKSLCEG